jgi:serine/threonine protein phosphatase PrpC
VTQPQTPTAAPGGSDSKPDAEGIRVQVFARTDVGQIREHNEDNFLVADLTQKSRGLTDDSPDGGSAGPSSSRFATIGRHGSVFAVCDGMGGAAAGEIASQLAVDIVFERLVDGLDGNRHLSRDDLARRLVRAIEAAGLRIFQEAKVDRTRRGMGTTVTAAALLDSYLFFAQVGDSRGYLLRQGQLVQLTRDQSLVNQLIEAGQLTEEEAETFEHNNIILQALGTADTVQVDLTFCELRKGDTLLLCSDGLSGMVRFEDIREVLRSAADPAEACQQLTDRANQAGGHDNVTVIVATFDGAPLPSAHEGEPLKYRKYVLPEEATEGTEPGRRLTPENAPGMPSGTPTSGLSLPQGLGSTFVFSPPQNPAPAPTPSLFSPKPPPLSSHDDEIDIPGTHVPAWVVVLIVVAVMGLLAATARFLLLD